MAPFAAVVVLLTAVPETVAQMEREGLVDEVVAIVGDSVILLSQVVQQENQWRAQGRPVPEEGTREREEFRQERLEDLGQQLLGLPAAALQTPARTAALARSWRFGCPSIFARPQGSSYGSRLPERVALAAAARIRACAPASYFPPLT